MALKFTQPSPPPTAALPPSNEASFITADPDIELVAAFVKQRGRAACSDLMVAFKLSYAQAVKWMDALEEREVIPPLARGKEGNLLESGPRKVS